MASEPILVVEDNPMNVRLITFVLRKCGHEVRVAGDAPGALALLRDWIPRLILMDLQLPGIDGLELTRLLRADSRFAEIPIVAVTAFAMKGDEERARSAGCDGYVTKPIDTRAFPGVVQSFLATLRPSTEVIS